MAKHSEIAVGSVGWVIREGGQDVPVKVTSKERKASGRGFEFRVRRIGPDGNATGRSLVRGAGALRKPGSPVREFGGRRAAPPRRVVKNPPAKAPAPPRRAAPSTVISRPPPAKRSAPKRPSTPATPAPRALESLRGQRKAAPVPRKAPTRRAATPLVDVVCREIRAFTDGIEKAIRRTDGSEGQIRNALAIAMSQTAQGGGVRGVVAAVFVRERDRARDRPQSYAY